jgi:hypothetical protein
LILVDIFLLFFFAMRHDLLCLNILSENVTFFVCRVISSRICSPAKHCINVILGLKKSDCRFFSVCVYYILLVSLHWSPKSLQQKIHSIPFLPNRLKLLEQLNHPRGPWAKRGYYFDEKF